MTFFCFRQGENEDEEELGGANKDTEELNGANDDPIVVDQSAE